MDFYMETAMKSVRFIQTLSLFVLLLLMPSPVSAQATKSGSGTTIPQSEHLKQSLRKGYRFGHRKYVRRPQSTLATKPVKTFEKTVRLLDIEDGLAKVQLIMPNRRPTGRPAPTGFMRIGVDVSEKKLRQLIGQLVTFTVEPRGNTNHILKYNLARR